MANRQERIISIIGKNIREIVQFEVKNPKIGFVTISEVDVSSDFSYAKVYVTFLNAKYPAQNLAELNKARGFVRSKLASKLDIRKTPEVSFVLDNTFEKIDSLEKALKKDRQELDLINKKKDK